MLERKGPEKYNGPGHVRWTGRIYGSVLTCALRWRRARVYHGIWGVAPYQSLYEPAPSLLASLPQMPEWYLMIAMLVALSALSFVWSPIKLLLPVLVIAALPPLTQACVSAMRASFPNTRSHRGARMKRRLFTPVPPPPPPLAPLRGRAPQGRPPPRCAGTGQ